MRCKLCISHGRGGKKRADYLFDDSFLRVNSHLYTKIVGLGDLHIFKQFLLAVESRDLYQAEKKITVVNLSKFRKFH